MKPNPKATTVTQPAKPAQTTKPATTVTSKSTTTTPASTAPKTTTSKTTPVANTKTAVTAAKVDPNKKTEVKPANKQPGTQLSPTKKEVEAPPKLETKVMPLMGLNQIFQSKNRDCLLLMDQTGNAYTFFKYKAKLADVASLAVAVNSGLKTKESAIEEIRKVLLWGIKSGDITVLHLGDPFESAVELLKGAIFWEPKNLFKKPENISQQWFQAKLVKEDDTDYFGNRPEFLMPSKEYLLVISVDKNQDGIALGNSLGVDLSQFVAVQIQ